MLLCVFGYVSVVPENMYAAVTYDTTIIHQQVGDVVVPQPSPPSPGGVSFLVPEFSISGVSTDPSVTGVVVSWTTTTPSVATLVWGTEGVYGKGQLTEISSVTEHSVSIDGLSPGTQYALSLRATDVYGRVVTVEGILFRTDRILDMTSPANVSDFTATYRDEGVDVSWNNPPDADFKRVRIVRSDIFFPEDPYDGLVVYEGRKEFVRDTWIHQGTTYYYAAFAEDDSGNYASGALARVRIPELEEGSEDEEEGDDVFDDGEILPTEETIPEDLRNLSFDDFRFIQFGKDVVRRGDTIMVDASGNLQISLGYDAVPEVLKTIGITLTDSDDSTKTFPFLLRREKEEEAYAATLAPFARPGIYRVSATVLDYKHQVLKKFEGKLVVPGIMGSEENPMFVGLCAYCTEELNGWRFLLCYGWIALLLILMLLLRRRKKKKYFSKLIKRQH